MKQYEFEIMRFGKYTHELVIVDEPDEETAKSSARKYLRNGEYLGDLVQPPVDLMPDAPQT